MKYISAFLLLLGLAYGASAQTGIDVRFGNEAADTLRITDLIDRCVASGAATPNERVAFFAQEFLGTPYGAHTLEVEPEMLTVRLDSIDCTTFVETVLALAQTAGERRHSWRDFVYNLQRLRYRGGVVDGYPSRLHYIADWASDNIHRGNVSDACRVFPKTTYMVKNIDFMTRNRSRYPALADSANFQRIKSIESGYRNHRFPYIKSNDTGAREVRAAFRSGDAVALVSNLPGLDISHLGIIIKDEAGIPHLLHASYSGGKVQYETRPLDEFLRKNRRFLGVRVFRLAE